MPRKALQYHFKRVYTGNRSDRTNKNVTECRRKDLDYTINKKAMLTEINGI